MPERDEARGVPATFLCVTAGICGATVMAVEVLGSRVIGPWFGVSLFVWTSLISVTLLSLAAGYAAGGALADRRPSPDVLYAIILAAGALVLLVPVLREPVLRGSADLGLRSGALVAAALLFAPALLLLGAVSPFLVRLAAPEPGRVGRTVGLLSSISTAGSFAGTLATGFLLIPRIGVSRILQATGALLLLLAVAWFVAFRARRSAAVVLLLPLVVPGPPPLRSVTQPNGTVATELLRRETSYGLLKVVEYAFGERRTREMLIDGLVQGGVEPATGLSVYEYAYLLQWIPRALQPAGRRALVIGLGTGAVPSWYEAQGVPTDVVDIDPEVVDAAREFFSYRPKGQVHVEDGRAFLARAEGTWDYVILDAFNGDVTPGHLLSREALELARRRLAPGGVFAANLIGTLGDDPFVAASVVKTLGEVFETVHVYPLFDPTDPKVFGNIEVVAYDGPGRSVPWDELSKRPVHSLARETIDRTLGREWRIPAGAPAAVLTDDYDPVDFRGRLLRERLRRGILDFTERSLLL